MELYRRTKCCSRNIFLIFFVVPFLFGFTFSGVSFTKPILRYWANSGFDKVTRDEMRLTNGYNIDEYNNGNVINHVWDGSKISVKGFRNEIVQFAVYLEASQDVSDISVAVGTFYEVGGEDTITTESRSANDTLFDYSGRYIQLFYARYLKQTGVSKFSAYTGDDSGDERITKKMQRPMDYGRTSGPAKVKRGSTFYDRPWANKYIPEPLIPIELHPTFSISANTNQMIQCDITIPKTINPGIYKSNFIISQNGNEIKSIPIELEVYDSFVLPDTPSRPSWVWTDMGFIFRRFSGSYDCTGCTTEAKTNLWTNTTKMLWNHKVLNMLSMDRVGDIDSGNYDYTNYYGCLDGTFFDDDANFPDGYYPEFYIGVFGIEFPSGWGGGTALGTDNEAELLTESIVDEWDVVAAAYPNTTFYVYMCDEGGCNQTNTDIHAQWITEYKNNSNIKTFATAELSWANTYANSLDVASATVSSSSRKLIYEWKQLGKECFYYNGVRPRMPNNHLDAAGVSLFVQQWISYKVGLYSGVWYYLSDKWKRGTWPGREAEIDIYNDAINFGTIFPEFDSVLGMTASATSFLDGCLTYPGVNNYTIEQDIQDWTVQEYGISYSDISLDYDINGVFPGMLLKQIRRGVQDAEYLIKANSIDPQATQAVLNEMLSDAFFYDDDDRYQHWSDDPDDWEDARRALVDIILE